MMSPNDYASAFDANIYIQASAHPEIPDVKVNVDMTGPGKDGYTPQRGVDYWTEEDKNEIVEDVLDQIVNDGSGGVASLPVATATRLGGVKVGHNLTIDADGTLSINTTNDIEQDNTRPITSAGVYATVGNIEALLKTI